MEKVNKITKQEIVNREFNKYFEKKTMLEFEIALQKQLDPEELSARKPLATSAQGQPISWKQIRRKEHIEELEKSLENVDLILKTLENL
mgnify:CR=1 FL=1